MILTGDPPIEIALKRSARARRLSLRVSRLDGRVTLSLPKRVPVEEALAFAQEKEHWIRKHLEQQPKTEKVQIGGQVLFEGRLLKIVPEITRRVRVEQDALVVPDQPARTAAQIRAFLKVAARDRLQAASDHYASAVGCPYARLTLRDTRSRWGSCTAEGNLMYSWRLVMAPAEVLRYVAAHEAAHLKELNHSPAYWSVVEKIYPDYQAPRSWLRKNGGLLHQYSFTD